MTYAGLADLERRVRELNGDYKMDAEIAEVLNREEYARQQKHTVFAKPVVDAPENVFPPDARNFGGLRAFVPDPLVPSRVRLRLITEASFVP